MCGGGIPIVSDVMEAIGSVVSDVGDVVGSVAEPVFDAVTANPALTVAAIVAPALAPELFAGAAASEGVGAAIGAGEAAAGAEAAGWVSGEALVDAGASAIGNTLITGAAGVGEAAAGEAAGWVSGEALVDAGSGIAGDTLAANATGMGEPGTQAALKTKVAELVPEAPAAVPQPDTLLTGTETALETTVPEVAPEAPAAAEVVPAATPDALPGISDVVPEAAAPAPEVVAQQPDTLLTEPAPVDQVGSDWSAGEATPPPVDQVGSDWAMGQPTGATEGLNAPTGLSTAQSLQLGSQIGNLLATALYPNMGEVAVPSPNVNLQNPSSPGQAVTGSASGGSSGTMPGVAETLLTAGDEFAASQRKAFGRMTLLGA